VKEARPMRSACEEGGTEKEAGPLRRRPGLSQKLDAGSRGKDPDQLQVQPGPMDPMRREVTKTPERKQS